MARARANVGAARLSDLVEIREADALQSLARDLPDQIDLVLLDGAKSLHAPILSLLEGHLHGGATLTKRDESASILIAKFAHKSRGCGNTQP